MSIYHWNLGDIALARICKKVYAKVKVVKNEDGLFYDDKILAMRTSDDNPEPIEELCYYVEIIRSGDQLWLPYTCLHLAERSRPFYGNDKQSPTKPGTSATATTPKKRKSKEDHILPLHAKLPNPQDPDLNTTYDSRHTPLQNSRYENAFREFVRRGKEKLFDEFYTLMEQSENTDLKTLCLIDNKTVNTEEKFDAVIKDVVTEKEIENYLHQCWRYNFLNRQAPGDTGSNEGSDDSNPTSPTIQPVTIHVSFCLVCGNGGRLRECARCPAAFHPACRREWLTTIIHRKKPPQHNQTVPVFVERILSSTRALTVDAAPGVAADPALCPSCMWGPKVGYDDVVWHKLGPCAWWPARVLPPGGAPAKLLARAHHKRQWALRYYGTLNYAWGEATRMCLFLPRHTTGITPRDPVLQQAMLDASDDYITVYLT